MKFIRVTVFAASIFLFGIAAPSGASAWDDCPFGIENDEYPGECPRYIDTDGDGICDRSQEAPEDRNGESGSVADSEVADESDIVDDIADASEEAEHEELYSVSISGQEMKELTIKEIADLWYVDPEELLSEIVSQFNLRGTYNTNTDLDEMREEYSFSPSLVKDIAEGLLQETEIDVLPEGGQNRNESKNVSASPYNFFLPFTLSLVAYLVTWYVTTTSWAKKQRLLSRPVFNLFWNTVLIISAVPSILFGFYLVFRYSVPELREVNFDFLYWHVEGSIVFGTVAVMHLVSRLKQYLAPSKLIGKR